MIDLRSLAGFATPPARAARCELCATPLAADHRHVVEIGKRGVLCACPACAILFASGDRYKTVPARVLADHAFALPALGIPVSLALVYQHSAPLRGAARSGEAGPCGQPAGRRVLGYPGPAGIVETDLDDGAWNALVEATPLARKLEDDVEALLVRERACYLVPISRAFELVARLRATWQGFTGGDAATRELDAFFAEMP